ncbi:MAG TPA: ABC transporter substrate-binding protein [Pyrinomonadaceae bacterium]|nr:ABC transporter substrate-binding protein [Pyrinomonadaceae bacterium]
MKPSLGSLFLMVFLLGGTESEAQARIVVGVSSVNVAFLPLYVTIEKGFFKDEGLDIIPVMFNSGTTNLQSLIGGDVQIIASSVAEPFSPESRIRLEEQGFPVLADMAKILGEFPFNIIAANRSFLERMPNATRSVSE